ncbi:UNVERIFIED_CONTAM: hypothetical protein HDU68_008882 [Siphonaria sp. JEL0065]|nr:hypothetical protein HDU68_008882 [Siphonaria sp. JEL0065]
MLFPQDKGVKSGSSSALIGGIGWISGHAKFELNELQLLLSKDRITVSKKMMRDACVGGDDEDLDYKDKAEYVEIVHAEVRGDEASQVRTWGNFGRAGISMELDEVSEDLYTVIVSNGGSSGGGGVRKRESNVSLGSVEVLDEGLIENRLIAALEYMKKFVV